MTLPTKARKPVKAQYAWCWQSKVDGSLAWNTSWGQVGLMSCVTKKNALQRGVNRQTHRIVRVLITVLPTKRRRKS